MTVPHLAADGTKATARRMLRRARRRLPFYVGEGFVDSGGYITILNGGGPERFIGHVLAPGREALSVNGKALALGAPLPVTVLERSNGRRR